MKNHAYEAFVRNARLQQSIAVGDFIADSTLAVWRGIAQAGARLARAITTLAAKKPAARPKAA